MGTVEACACKQTFIHRGMGFPRLGYLPVQSVGFVVHMHRLGLKSKKGAEGHVFPALYSDIALSFPYINSMTCVCLCQGESSRISELVNVLEY